jgi:hypothetical protein
MSTILDPLVERLRAIPSSLWEQIAQEAGCALSLPRKLAARDRDNPRVQTIQPLVDYFADVDAGRRQLPNPDQNDTPSGGPHSAPGYPCAEGA